MDSLLARPPDPDFAGQTDLPRLLTGGTGTIGVRQPRQTLICRLMAALGLPHDRHQRQPLRAAGPDVRAAEVAREFGDGVDLILDAGPCPGGLPSTIVDVTSVPAPPGAGRGDSRGRAARKLFRT